MLPTLLLTGGTGYIASHAAVSFIEAGCRVVLCDNLCNSSVDTVGAIARITGTEPEFRQGDIRDREFLRSLFSAHEFSAVVHFAALKSVGESVGEPFRYYDNNISGSLALFEAMERAGCRKLVFSSSATVYRADGTPPFTEESPLGTANPYGTTKLVTEHVLADLARHLHWRVAALRYFNPIGAHASGLIGERPRGTPNNLLPYIMDVAAGRRERVTIYGDDYDTPDGTGVRDYVHVMDLARAHVAAADSLARDSVTSPFEAYNIGTGHGTSVREMIRHTENISGRSIDSVVAHRRPGDIGLVYCDPSKAERALGWKAAFTVEEGVRDSWNFTRRACGEAGE